MHAGAGGVGYAALQIALARGAKVFTTVSADKRALVESLGATAIERGTPVAQYLTDHTADEGFDVVYDTLGGPVLDQSFIAVKRYTGHVVSCLGWGTHALSPFRFELPPIPECSRCSRFLLVLAVHIMERFSGMRRHLLIGIN